MKIFDKGHVAFRTRLSKKGEKREMKNLIDEILCDNKHVAKNGQIESENFNLPAGMFL